MPKLDLNDLRFAVARLPVALRNLMMKPEWSNQIFVGGGYLRCIITGDKLNDVDVFAKSVKDAESIANILAPDSKSIVRTENAFTVKGKVVIQVIHRWVFDKAEDVSNSFDFTCCCAAISCEVKPKKGSSKEYYSLWDSFSHERFYMDIAARRLVYLKPKRNEDAGGSVLRVLKYYQKGFRIPLDSFGAVIARLVFGVSRDNHLAMHNEEEMGRVLTGLLRVVDPNLSFVDDAHMPPLEDDVNFVVTDPNYNPGDFSTEDFMKGVRALEEAGPEIDKALADDLKKLQEHADEIEKKKKSGDDDEWKFE